MAFDYSAPPSYNTGATVIWGGGDSSSGSFNYNDWSGSNYWNNIPKDTSGQNVINASSSTPSAAYGTTISLDGKPVEYKLNFSSPYANFYASGGASISSTATSTTVQLAVYASGYSTNHNNGYDSISVNKSVSYSFDPSSFNYGTMNISNNFESNVTFKSSIPAYKAPFDLNDVTHKFKSGGTTLTTSASASARAAYNEANKIAKTAYDMAVANEKKAWEKGYEEARQAAIAEYAKEQAKIKLEEAQDRAKFIDEILNPPKPYDDGSMQKLADYLNELAKYVPDIKKLVDAYIQNRKLETYYKAKQAEFEEWIKRMKEKSLESELEAAEFSSNRYYRKMAGQPLFNVNLAGHERYVATDVQRPSWGLDTKPAYNVEPEVAKLMWYNKQFDMSGGSSFMAIQTGIPKFIGA